jgi:hypothetical protein
VPNRVKVVQHRGTGIRFQFAYDPDDPEILHIFARHLTSERDAVRTFFLGSTRWNSSRQRFETTTDTHVLYWFWLVEGELVQVISCFTDEEL